ncbi:hypothetical protein [Paraglaciecola sp. L3A3]|uniref:hypothetical protein n=1 Tax=Paraglaciecola sp. L3A3 TaxID=2686358 RepID=UPI00131D922D|nr:hypothetical protein [Paraglaciecola sp. L3A3]
MKYSIGLLWVFSLLGAYYIGNSLQQTPASNTDVSVAEVPSPFLVSTSVSQTQHLPTRGEQEQLTVAINQQSSSNQLDPYQLLQQAKTLLDNSSRMNISKLAKAYNLIQELSPEQLFTALNELDTSALDAESTQLFSLLLSRYAEFEPENAMAFIAQQVESNKAQAVGRFAVLSTWAENDPLTALDWFKTSVSSNQFSQENRPLHSIFSNLAKQDVDLAIDSLAPFAKNMRQLSMAVSGLTRLLSTSEDFIHVMDKTKELDNKKLTQDVVRAWARTEPEDAIEWLATIEDEKQKKQLEYDIYRTWLFSDSDRAAEVYMNTADSTNRQARAQFVARSLSYINPDKAVSWLQQQGGIDSDFLVKKVVKESARNNPEFASTHLDVFTDKKEYLASSVSIYMSFARNSQTQADNFLAESPYKNELQTQIAEQKKRMEKYRRKN